MIAREKSIPLPFYLKKYLVTERGMIKCKRTGIMLMPGSSNGYLYVFLSYKGQRKMVYIHKMVALAFIENRKGKRCVNHIDGDKWNNSVENLEWCTHSENSIHYHRCIKKTA